MARSGSWWYAPRCASIPVITGQNTFVRIGGTHISVNATVLNCSQTWTVCEMQKLFITYARQLTGHFLDREKTTWINHAWWSLAISNNLHRKKILTMIYTIFILNWKRVCGLDSNLCEENNNDIVKKYI